MSVKVNLKTIQLEKNVGGKVINSGNDYLTIKLNDTGMSVILDVLEANSPGDIPIGSEVSISPDGVITVVTVKDKPIDTTIKRKTGCTTAERQAAMAGL